MHTVVSACSFAINEKKPGIFPDSFLLDAADPKNGVIKTLHIDDGKMIRYIRDGESINLPVPSKELAESVVNDLLISIPGYDGPSKSHPALFCIEGKWSEKDIRTRFKDELDKALESQVRWFHIIVRLADDEWAAYHQHRMISDLQRYAANYLGLNKEWAKDIDSETLQKCPACSSLIEETALICRHCRTILKPDEMKERGLSQVVG